MAFGLGATLAASLLGSVGSSIASGLSTASANKLSYKINQENREWQSGENEIAREWQEEMMDKYSDPAYERERLEAAGYNPYMAYSGDTGTSVSTPSASGSTSAPSSPMMQAQKWDFSGVQNAINSYYNNKAMVASTGQTEIDNLSRNNLNQARISQILGNTDWSKASPEYRRVMEGNATEMAHLNYQRSLEEVKNLRLVNDLRVAEQSGVLLDNEIKMINKKWLDDEKLLNLNYMAASYENAVATGQYTYQYARTQLSQAVKNMAEAEGIRINNKIASRTAEALIKATIDSKRYESSYYRGMSPRENAASYERGQRAESKMKEFNYENRWLFYGLDKALQVGNSVGSLYKVFK